MLQIFVDISLKKFCYKRRHEAIIKKKERKKERKVKEKKEKKETKRKKKKMTIKIAHVLTKIFQVPIKREMCFKEHSRIKLATINFLHTCTS
jgi:hypothetical protein